MISDPIEFELFKNALFGAADEMALTVFRTTYSGVLKDNMDYSTALFDGDGTLVAQGLTLPGHLGSMPTAIASVKSAFAGRVYPATCSSSTTRSAAACTCPTCLSSSRSSGRRRASPGRPRSATTPMSAAGCRDRTRPIRPRSTRKACASHRSSSTSAANATRRCSRVIESNVRLPVKVFGDLRAQLAACHIAEQAIHEMAARYGEAKLAQYMTELVDYAERMTRAAISDLPDGVYDFLDHIDDDGIDVGRPIPLKVAITKTG